MNPSAAGPSDGEGPPPSDASAVQIFRKGSATYFNSSRFFPEPTRSEVATLYAFVRKADDYVDAIPQQEAAFRAFVGRYRRAAQDRPTGDPVVDDFVALARRKEFDPQWIDAFLQSMEMDLVPSTYRTVEELNRYIYGSAAVVGLMMARVLDLPPAAHPYAAQLGNAMQYVNFIRDVAEDLALGRAYLPLKDREAAGLSGLEEEEARGRPEAFARFMAHQVARYEAWQREAEAGFRFLPLRYRVAIQTASSMYRWTARRIREDPFLVYEKKVKPSRVRILLWGTFHWIRERLAALGSYLPGGPWRSEGSRAGRAS